MERTIEYELRKPNGTVAPGSLVRFGSRETAERFAFDRFEVWEVVTTATKRGLHWVEVPWSWNLMDGEDRKLAQVWQNRPDMRFHWMRNYLGSLPREAETLEEAKEASEKAVRESWT